MLSMFWTEQTYFLASLVANGKESLRSKGQLP